MRKIILFLIILLCIILSSCNSVLQDTPIVVAPTCTEDGYTYYVDSNGNTVLDEFGTVKKTDIVPAKGHSPGPEATTSTPQVCTVCGAVLRDIRDISSGNISDYNDKDKNGSDGKTSLNSKSAGFATNAYINATDENNVAYCNNIDNFIVTEVDSQYHNKYQKTFPYRNANGNSQDLKLSITTQEFFSHDVLSLNEVSTMDGKTLVTDSAFQVRYLFNCDQFYLSETTDFTQIDAWKDDSSKGSELDADNLRFIKYFQPIDGYNGDGYNGVYLLIDIASAEIEVSHKTSSGYERVSTLNIGEILTEEDDSLNCLNGKIILTDAGKPLFFNKGIYRFVFKYGLVWFANTTPVKDAHGNDCWPWGYINDQYDSFYVTIDDTANILFPDRTKADEEEDNYFYQISALDVRTYPTGNSIIVDCAEVENRELIFSETKDGLSFVLNNNLHGTSEGLFYLGNRLTSFSAAFYVQNKDLGFDRYADLDLIGTFSSQFEEGKNVLITVRADPLLRTKSCKLSISYTFEGQDEKQQNYYFKIDW